MAQAVVAAPRGAPANSYRLPALALGLVATLAVLADVVAGTGAWFFAVAGVSVVVIVMLRPEVGIALFLSTFMVTYPTALQGSGFLTINNVLGLVFVVMLAHRVYLTGDWSFLRHSELMLLVVIALAYYASSVLNGPEPRLLSLIGPQEKNDTLRLFVNRVAFVLFFVSFIRTEAHARLVYMVAIGLMVLGVVIGVRAVLSGSGLSGYRAVNWVVSTVGNPNRLAMVAIIAVGALWYLLRVVRGPIVRALIVGTMLIMVLGVVMSASRSGVGALIVCVAFILIDEGFEVRKLLGVALVAVIALALVAQLVPSKTVERLSTVPGTQAGSTGLGSGSLERRQYTYEIGLQIVKQNLVLGVGPGNWEITRFLNDPAHITTPPHSSYVLAMAEGGLGALVGFLMLFWRTWTNLGEAQRLLPDRGTFWDVYWIVKGARVGMLAIIVFSAFADLWQSVILFWLIGLGVVLRRYATERYAVA